MEGIPRLHSLLFVAINFISAVEAANPDIVGLAVAGSVAFLLLFLVVFYIAVSFNWGDWTKQMMRNRGKIKMSRAYFKKKEEAKRRLLSANVSHTSASVVNGSLPAQTVDRVNENGKASWVQGWNQRSNVYNNGVYEEKDVTLELGEEQDDEFRIETTIVDNEVLDVGPFKNAQSHERPTDGDIYPEPYIYSTIDKPASIRRQNSSSATPETPDSPETPEPVASTSSTGGEMREVERPVSEGADVTRLEEITRFEDMLVKL